MRITSALILSRIGSGVRAGADEADPANRDDALDALLGDGRHVGQEGRTALVGDAQRLHLGGVDRADGAGHGVRHQLDVARLQRHQRIGVALEAARA